MRLAAIKDALDRAGLVAPKTVDVAIAPKPWEQIFDDLTGGSRAESRASRGVPDDGELDATGSTHLSVLVGGIDAQPIVDAEVIESQPDVTDLPPVVNEEPVHSDGRRTYTLSDS